jgi:hypothetical protein
MSAEATRALQQKVRRIVWTGAIASVTVVGTIYGAGLKTQKEEEKVRTCLALFFIPQSRYVADLGF